MKKAREYGKPFVNVQWLNEILFGRFAVIQQADSPKFQQYVGNPFKIEPSYVPLIGKRIVNNRSPHSHEKQVKPEVHYIITHFQVRGRYRFKYRRTY